MQNSTTASTPAQGPLTYLALGDSYTIAESVSPQYSFPMQLSEQLNASGLKVALPKIIAKTGWTTSELRDALNAAELFPVYDIVTLLIGVNNQYRGDSMVTYRSEFKELLQVAIALAGGNKSHVFVLSIPDWGVTPFGKSKGAIGEISNEINAFNAINKEETIQKGLSYTNITPMSRKADSDTALVASDGLHPSAAMYGEWVKLLSPSIRKVYQ